MIIQCEKCRTNFELDDSSLREDGSKVRCSICKHIFMVYPTSQVMPEEAPTVEVKKDELSETVSLESSPIQGVEPAESSHGEKEIDFENVFEESMEHLEKFEAVSPEDMKNLFLKDGFWAGF